MANNPKAADNLKPFTKNDKRINRDGRPKDAVSLAALVRRIGHEVATTKDGKPMTVVEVILRQKAQSVKGQAEFLDRGWGKVPQSVEVGGTGGGPIVVRWDETSDTD